MMGPPYTCKHKQQSQMLTTKKHETKQEQAIQLLETQTCTQRWIQTNMKRSKQPVLGSIISPCVIVLCGKCERSLKGGFKPNQFA